MRIRRGRWTQTEDSILREQVSAGRSVPEIAAKIGRTESAIRTRAYILRVTLRRKR